MYWRPFYATGQAKLLFFLLVACNLIYFLVAVSHVVLERRKLPSHGQWFLYLCYPTLRYRLYQLFPASSLSFERVPLVARFRVNNLSVIEKVDHFLAPTNLYDIHTTVLLWQTWEIDLYGLEHFGDKMETCEKCVTRRRIVKSAPVLYKKNFIKTDS